MTAALAATIASIYSEYQGIIEREIDCGEGRTTNRAMLLAALMETNFWEEDNLDMAPSRLDQPPSPDSNDFEEWEFLVQCLRTVVLPDNDFEMEESFLDLPPEKGALLKDHLGIQSDYFFACPEDPSAEELLSKVVDSREVKAAYFGERSNPFPKTDQRGPGVRHHGVFYE